MAPARSAIGAGWASTFQDFESPKAQAECDCYPRSIADSFGNH